MYIFSLLALVVLTLVSIFECLLFKVLAQSFSAIIRNGFMYENVDCIAGWVECILILIQGIELDFFAFAVFNTKYCT